MPFTISVLRIAAATTLALSLSFCVEVEPDQGAETDTPSADEVTARDDLPTAANDLSVVGQAACATRADYRGELEVSSGDYGSWASCMDFCPAGSFVYSLAVRAEFVGGSNDDTGVNELQFGCKNRYSGNSPGYVTSSKGWWGSWWYPASNQPLSQPAVQADTMTRPSQGSADDFGMTWAMLTTANGTQMSGGLYNNQDYSRSKRCPVGQAICGLRTRLEGKKGTRDDDTALNGLIIACCAF